MDKESSVKKILLRFLQTCQCNFNPQSTVFLIPHFPFRPHKINLSLYKSRQFQQILFRHILIQMKLVWFGCSQSGKGFIISKKNVRCKKLLGPRKFGVPKKFWSKKFLIQKNFLVQKKVWVQNKFQGLRDGPPIVCLAPAGGPKAKDGHHVSA